jgi:TPR repeat protein
MGQEVSQKARNLFKDAQSENDPAKVAALYLEATKLGHPAAGYYYGQCLEMGSGVELNVQEALRYFGQAASHGHRPAIFRMAMHSGMTADSMADLQKCAEDGFMPGVCALGMAVADTNPSQVKGLLSSAASRSAMAKFGLWLIAE